MKNSQWSVSHYFSKLPEPGRLEQSEKTEHTFARRLFIIEVANRIILDDAGDLRSRAERQAHELRRFDFSPGRIAYTRTIPFSLPSIGAVREAFEPYRVPCTPPLGCRFYCISFDEFLDKVPPLPLNDEMPLAMIKEFEEGGNG